jgi:3-methyladenine DNA glycosylase/8-oxoguanine DNA glycosylase
MPGQASNLTLPVPRGFDLQTAVCSYGYFILAPNHWDNDTRTFTRPLQGKRGRAISVTISQPKTNRRSLRLACDKRLDTAERSMIKDQARRMLRVDEDFSGWFKLHPIARRKNFCRLFCSPTLFEDIVKTITGCNVTWSNTVRMNRFLCDKIGTRGAFPTPGQLAAVTPARLKADCRVGYRAERIIRLARDVESGQLDLSWFEQPGHSADEIYKALLAIYGLGPFAASNICQLLGHYGRIAIDTETYRHFCKTYGVKRPKDPSKLHPRIEKHYAQYAPYQFLAYWFELWCGYEAANGKPAPQWLPEEAGDFTANKLNSK